MLKQEGLSGKYVVNDKLIISNIQGVHEILCFFPRIFNILRPRLRQHWAAIGCTVNGQPIRVTVHSDLRSDELLSYMQGMGCSELEKKHNF